MLDANELRRRLRDAMDNAVPPVTSAALAAECKVTPQAVNGWRKTGRVAKRHLQRIALLTGRPVEFFLGADPGTVPANFGMTLSITEAEAVKRLREALPEWRRYVVSLAMTTDHARQRLFLDMLTEHAPDESVAAAYGKPGRET